jgi:hypothetical protein
LIEQTWFEMKDIRRRFYANAVWIPLRASQPLLEVGRFGYVGYQEEFFGVGTLAVPLASKQHAQTLGWMDVGISHSHAGYVQDNLYTPAHLYRDYQGRFEAEHLVLEQRGNSVENKEWHLAQDLSITLGLKREGNVWVRPDEGYIDVVRLKQKANGDPELIEMRSGHLRDYLAARGMSLYITSYRQRTVVLDHRNTISWQQSSVSECNETDRWEGRVSDICEGGMPYGESTAVFHVARTDVDPDEDVPDFGFPTDDVVESKSWTKKHEGKKLFLIQGALWRNEWVDPAASSPIVRGDEVPPSVFFVTDSSGKLESRDSLTKESRWLWFKPEVIMALAHRRGGSLSWYTRDTGSVRCSPDYGVHFGVNKLCLINVYAKDIGLLPDWQQKTWAGYNTSPDGKVAEELLASQMRAQPTDTQAPEGFLAIGLKKINEISRAKLRFPLLREHDAIPELIPRVHRFRAVDDSGLYALAKDLARLTADSIDAAAIQTVVGPPKGAKWGSLKSLENLIARKTGPDIAHDMLGSLVGLYELRHGDAHLPGSDIEKAFQLVGVNREQPTVYQGLQMLHACVSSIFGIIEVLNQWDEQS